MTQRALITGAEGFVGKVLRTHLKAKGWEVCGTDRRRDPDDASSFTCDITDPKQVNALVEWATPVTHVFHLAAVTFVPQASETPSLAFDVNLQGTVHLADALRAQAPDARLLYVSSAAVYGAPEQLPIAESHPLKPANPYAISKAAADHYCAYLVRAGLLDAVRVRPFNHSGPGQTPDFVLSSFAHQIAQIEAGKVEPVLRVGNLEASREFLHVRDVVAAYEVLARKGESGEAYNVCSGKDVRIEDALNALLQCSEATIRVEQDPARTRPVDVARIYGDLRKLAARTGWRPEIPFESLLDDLLTYWRAALDT